MECVDVAAHGDGATDLFAIREEWHAAGEAGDEHWRAKLFGLGRSLSGALRLTASVVFGTPSIAREWCELYAWPKQNAYAFARNSRACAFVLALAREFTRRSKWFFGLWLEGEAVSPTPFDMLLAYEQGPSFVEWVATMGAGDHWCHRKAGDIMDLAHIMPAAA